LISLKCLLQCCVPDNNTLNVISWAPNVDEHTSSLKSDNKSSVSFRSFTNQKKLQYAKKKNSFLFLVVIYVFFFNSSYESYIKTKKCRCKKSKKWEGGWAPRAPAPVPPSLWNLDSLASSCSSSTLARTSAFAAIAYLHSYDLLSIASQSMKCSCYLRSMQQKRLTSNEKKPPTLACVPGF